MSGEELRALAEAATPGEWWRDSGWSVCAPPPEGWEGPHVVADTGERNNAAFIAAANPTAVLALLDERDALRAAVERVRALADEWETECDAVCCVGCQAAVEARHGAADDLRDALDPE